MYIDDKRDTDLVIWCVSYVSYIHWKMSLGYCFSYSFRSILMLWYYSRTKLLNTGAYFCPIVNCHIPYIQYMQYLEKSLLESQRPGTVQHSLCSLVELMHLIVGLYWWDSSSSISEVIKALRSTKASSSLVQGMASSDWSTQLQSNSRRTGAVLTLVEGWACTAAHRELRGARIFTTVHAGRMRQWMLRLYIRKLFFTMKAGRQWSSLTREVVQALSLVVFKEVLYFTRSNLVWPYTRARFVQELKLERLLKVFQMLIILLTCNQPQYLLTQFHWM